MKEYYAYRIFLNNQLGTFEFKKKEEAFYEVFENIKNENKVRFQDYGTEHVIFFYKELGSDNQIWQFSRRHFFEKPIVGELKIEEITDIEYPFVYLIFNLKTQIILIEKDTTVFQRLDSIKAKLERFLTNRMSADRISANLTEISDQREFWEKVEDFDVINKVELEYEPPNFFRGKKVVDKLVKDVYEETRYEKFKILLQNTRMGLKFEYDSFKEHIQRLASGAGNFMVKGIKDGIVKVIRNFNLPIKRVIEDIDTVTKESLDETFTEINELNKNEDR